MSINDYRTRNYSGADGESIRDAIEKHYGKATADLIESLF